MLELQNATRYLFGTWQGQDMDRRTYLQSVASAGTTASFAGCPGVLTESGSEETVLGPPEQDLSAASHPSYGNEMPDSPPQIRLRVKRYQRLSSGRSEPFSGHRSTRIARTAPVPHLFSDYAGPRRSQLRKDIQTMLPSFRSHSTPSETRPAESSGPNQEFTPPTRSSWESKPLSTHD